MGGNPYRNGPKYMVRPSQKIAPFGVDCKTGIFLVLYKKNATHLNATIMVFGARRRLERVHRDLSTDTDW